MKTWKIVLIPTLITLAIGGFYLYSVWKHRQEPGVVWQNDPTQALTKDDLVVLREFFPQHYEDTLRLEGTSVWMKNGYTMPYYVYTHGAPVLATEVGLIPAGQRLDVKKIIKAAVPASVHDSVEHGSRQAFAVFALPDSPEKLYATPIGYMQGSQEAYYTDLLFFYDDPHVIYSHWPKDVWSAIDAHQVEPGMSELETRASIGQNMHPDGEKEGDRTITFNQNGKHWTVTYVKNQATSIKTE